MKNKLILSISAFMFVVGGIYLHYLLIPAKVAGFYDIKYTVEYSPDSTFHYVSEWYEFYDRVRDKYYLKPSQVDIGHWIGKGPGTFGRSRQKYARIKAIVNDSTFYLTPPIKFMGCILSAPKFDFTLSKKKRTFTYNQ
jgi:hypothetical protein